MPSPPALPLVLSMGDPAGIGPEIIARAFRERPGLLRQVVVAGDVATLQRALRLTAPEAGSAAAALMLAEIRGLSDVPAVPPGCMAVVQACALPRPVAFGQVSAEAGRAAADCIRWAAQAALSGQARAVVTAPIHKEALSAAGVDHPGHTELLQSLAAAHAGVPVSALPVRMMLSCPGLSTVLVSIHVSLRDAIAAVTQDNVLQTLHALGLDSIEPVSVRTKDGRASVAPRDVVASVLPDPASLADRMTGKTCAGTLVTGTGLDGQKRATYLYHVCDTEWTNANYGSQAVVWQTALVPVISLELLATGVWSGSGVKGPEEFDAKPFLDLLAGEYGQPWGLDDRDPANPGKL